MTGRTTETTRAIVVARSIVLLAAGSLAVVLARRTVSVASESPIVSAVAAGPVVRAASPYQHEGLYEPWTGEWWQYASPEEINETVRAHAMTAKKDDKPPICKSCQKDREARSQEPRRLVQFSLATFDKDAPLNLCSYCDGEEVIEAISRCDSGE